MHNNILQLSRVPLTRDDWCQEDDFYNGFQGWIADYVSSVDDDTRDIAISDYKEGFDMSYRDFVTIAEDHIIFKRGFKDMYASVMLECVKEIVSNSTVNSVRTGNLRSLVEEILGDYHGLYIATGYGLIRENVWLTEHMEEDTPYYFGGVVSYHC